MKSFLCTFFLAVAFIGGVATGNAQLIYDNLYSNDPFQNAAGRGIGLEQQHAEATRFTAWETLLLDSAALTLWGDLKRDGTAGEKTSTVLVSLHAQTMDGVPGALLESAKVELTPPIVDAMPLTHAQFSNSTLLTAGTQYWLAVSPLDSETYTAWEFHDHVFGYVADRNLDRGWYALPFGNEEGGMRVFGTPLNVTPVPEPATYGAFSVLLAAAVVVLRGRQRSAGV